VVLLYFRFLYIHGIWLTASRTEEVYTSSAPSHDSSAKSRWELTSKVRVLQNDSLFISTYFNSQHRCRKLNSLRELNIPACKKYKIVLHQPQLCCSFRRNISNNCYQRMFRIQLIFQYDTHSECKNTHTHTHTYNVQVSIRVVFRRIYTGLHTCIVHTFVHIEHIYTCVLTHMHA